MILDSILKAHDRRMELVSRCQDTVTAYKQSKDMKSYQASRKSVEDAHQRFTEQVTSFHRQLHEYDPEGAAKVQRPPLPFQPSRFYCRSGNFCH